MTDAAQYLRAYDEQLRTDAEMAGALSVKRIGPLFLAMFDAGTGFVTYRNLDAVASQETERLIKTALEYFRTKTQVTEIEWKTRGHDNAPGLDEALRANGFRAQDSESIMIGPLEALTRDAPTPSGVTIRQITAQHHIRALSAMLSEASGTAQSAESLMERIAGNGGTQLWVAEIDGKMVSAGRLEPVTGTEFAGIWGGATLKEFRGRGIYRALTAARARAALAQGKTLVHSDSTEFSRPILERSGLSKVSTTTPYLWTR